MNIKLNTSGKIKAGKYQGWYVYVEELDGGYMILTSSVNDFLGGGAVSGTVEGEGYDNWLENFPSVELFFEKSRWEIEWIDNE